MISLSEYKQHLISVYSWPIDNSKDEFEKGSDNNELKFRI